MTLVLWVLFLALVVVVGRIWLEVFPTSAKKQQKIDEMSASIKAAAEKVTEKAILAYKRSKGE